MRFIGVVYDEEGNVIIDLLSAKNIKMNTKNNSFTISNGIQARVIIEDKVTKNGLIATETQTKKIKIKSTEMKYFSNNKRTYLNNDVELIKDDTVIKPLKDVEIDNSKNIVYIYHGFNLKTLKQL